MIFDFKLLDVGNTATALLVDVGLQLWRGERLLLVFADEQVLGLYLHDGIYLQAIGDVFQCVSEDAVLPVLGFPLVWVVLVTDID